MVENEETLRRWNDKMNIQKYLFSAKDGSVKYAKLDDAKIDVLINKEKLFYTAAFLASGFFLTITTPSSTLDMDMNSSVANSARSP